MDNKIEYNSDVIKLLSTSKTRNIDDVSNIDEYIKNLIKKTNDIENLDNENFKNDYISLLSLYKYLLDPANSNYYTKILKKHIRQDIAFKFLIFNSLIEIWKKYEYFGTVIYETIKIAINNHNDNINEDKSCISDISNISNFIREKNDGIYNLEKENQKLKKEISELRGKIGKLNIN